MSFALLCPGQGAQSPGLLKGALAGAEMADLRLALEQATGQSGDALDALPAEALHRNAIAQPIIAAFQLAQWRRLASALPRPALVAGYSLGELIATACAGALDAPACIALAAQRAQLMDSACDTPTAMLAARGLPRAMIEPLGAAQDYKIAIRNGDDRFVLAGPREGYAALEDAVLAAGGHASAVKVTTPSHTPRLVAAVVPFEAALTQNLARDPAVPIMSGLDGTLMRKKEVLAQRLARQLAEPLDWAACMDALAERGITVALELGPGADLSRMLHERCPQIAVRSLADFASLESALDWVQRAIKLTST